jgi:hypothetical protein
MGYKRIFVSGAFLQIAEVPPFLADFSRLKIVHVDYPTELTVTAVTASILVLRR